VKQLEGEKRLIANQLEQVNRKLEIMEESYSTLLKKNPTENEIRIS
jgi:Tfp pilus assembly protein PilO